MRHELPARSDQRERQKPRRQVSDAQADGLGSGETPTDEPEIRKGYSGSLLAFSIGTFNPACVLRNNAFILGGVFDRIYL